jgi:putative thioredoxin
MASPNIINVTESNFEYEVIKYSHTIPVIVDFWAEWCVPCKMLDPILRKLTIERSGDFRLAKVNVDENQSLAMRFNVSGIPAVKAFRDGNIVAQFSGVQPESKIREFLQELIPSHLDLTIEKGNSLLTAENWEESYRTFREAIEENPGHPAVLLGLAKCLLAKGLGVKARDILNSFPISPEFSTAEKLKPLAKALIWSGKVDRDTDLPIDATYHHALRLISLGNFPAAMDGILEVLRKDKNYRNGEAKQVILGLFEILGPQNPSTRQYQRELASVLF